MSKIPKKDTNSNQQPEQPDRMLIRQKILEQQMSRVRKMKITDFITRNRQPKQDNTQVTKPDNLISVARGLNESFDVHEGHPSTKTPGELWARQIMERQRLKRIYDKQLNKHPILHQIKRGRLGIDLYLIIFAATASFALPLYFFRKMTQNRQKVIQARGIDPDMIQYLDENSSVNIDDVSHQSYHYMNLDREDSVRRHLDNLDTMKKLQVDIEQM